MSRQTIISVLIGVVTGLMAGLTGLGGGVIMVPLLVGFLGLAQHKAHGTSLAIVIPIAIVAAAVYALQGYFRWSLVVQLAAASTIGAVFGARLMKRVPAPTLRRGFGLLLVLVAVRMFIATL